MGACADESLSMCMECTLVKYEWMSNEFGGGGGRRKKEKEMVQWEGYSMNGTVGMVY